MKIKKIKVKNYRSIKSETSLDFNSELVIIGPNNSGKTNLLKAINLFFNEIKENQYSIKNDLSFNTSGEQTSITISFHPDQQKDSDFLEKYKKVANLLDSDKETDTELISLYLSFLATTGRPNYRFFPNDKIKKDKKDEYRELNEELILNFLDRFVCHYIPSEKSSELLYSTLLLPHLKRKIGGLLQEQENLTKKVETAFNEISTSISQSIKKSNLPEINCKFNLPENLFSNALFKFDFFIDDGEETLFQQKGSGIQAAAILACLKWITEQENNDGKDVVWLIEEPESYLHPGLSIACRNTIESLSKISDVFTTTHAMGFIPKDYKKVVQSSITEKKETSFKTPNGYADATQSIRDSLGVQFSDYYNLTEYNIFVEGKTDKALIEHVLKIVKPIRNTNEFPVLRQASIMDFSGVTSLKDFLKSTYSFMSKERSIIAIFDGDQAGLKATADLRHYFSNKKIPFESNKEYIIIPNQMPIESLFPEEWLEDLSRDHPEWLTIERDAFEKITSLNMQSDKKSSICEWLIKHSEEKTQSLGGIYPWASNFIKIFNLLEDMLKKKHQSISILKKQED